MLEDEASSTTAMCVSSAFTFRVKFYGILSCFFSAGNRDLNSSTASNFHQRINLNSLNNERAEVDACQNESSFFCSILLFPIPSGVSDRRVASWRRNRRHVEHSTSDFTVVAPFCPKLRKRRRWQKIAQRRRGLLKEQLPFPVHLRLIDSVRLQKQSANKQSQ